MAEPRPGFARQDTDINLGNVGSSSKSSPRHGNAEFIDPDSKDRGFVGVQETGRDQSPPDYLDEEVDAQKTGEVHTAKDLTTQVLHVDDDPSLNPFTFRFFFLGSGLAIFGSVLQEIFYFKPQTIFVSVVFLTVIAYVLGEFMVSCSCTINPFVTTDMMTGLRNPTQRRFPLLEPRPVQSEGACGNHHHGLRCCSGCHLHRGSGSPGALLRRLPKPRCGCLHHIVVPIDRFWYCWTSP